MIDVVLEVVVELIGGILLACGRLLLCVLLGAGLIIVLHWLVPHGRLFAAIAIPAALLALTLGIVWEVRASRTDNGEPTDPE